MYSRTQSVQDGETNRPFWGSSFNINRFDFRSALVIEQSDVLRRSIVEHLKNKGWIVHGIKRAEQALPVLQHIPYHLIVIDCKVSGMTAPAPGACAPGLRRRCYRESVGGMGGGKAIDGHFI